MNNDKKEVVSFGLNFLRLSALPLVPVLLGFIFMILNYSDTYYNAHNTICDWFMIFLFSAAILLQLNFLIYMGVWLVKKCENQYLKKFVTTWKIPTLTLISLFIIDLIINLNLSEITQLYYNLLLSLTKNFLILYISVLITKFIQRSANEQ